jgi:hypothetical protein
MNQIKTDPNSCKIIGTAHWCGIYNDIYPAFLLSYYGGAALWVYQGNSWQFTKYKSLADAFQMLGIER